jgi:hypothetical protein
VTPEQLRRLLDRLYPQTPWPKPFGLLNAAESLKSGASLATVARDCGTTKSRVEAFIAGTDSIVSLFGVATPDDRSARRARQILGNLIVGRCAERNFVERYKREAATTELELKDVREGRSDTDYRLLNGKGRPVYRINIKFVGSIFRRAPELVGLQPDDCFALATYKIDAALKKQVADQLPFLFIVVSVPGLTSDEIGGKAPEDVLEFLGLLTHARGVPRKRDIEDHIVSMMEENADPGFLEVLDRIEHGNWYVLSARRADKLLREKLFERVYALRIRGFAQQFRGAELDMHFSFSGDLASLDSYLQTLREAGYPKVTTMLERGDL